MSGGSVTKIRRTYKKWTYIAKKTYNSRKNNISHKCEIIVTNVKGTGKAIPVTGRVGP
jgi:hypothetical protein